MPEAHIAYNSDWVRVPRTIFAHAHEDQQTFFPAHLNFNDTGLAFTLIPDNWNGLDKLYAWLISDTEETSNIDITIDLGTCAEAPNTHTQTVANHGVNWTAGVYHCLDLTTLLATVLANLAVRDMIKVSIKNSSGDKVIDYYGIELQET